MTYRRIGFTGTRAGMPFRQRQALDDLIRSLVIPSGEAHHGCCVGADVQFHYMLRHIFGRELKIVGHRATTMGQQAGQVVLDCDLVYQPLPPLVRNKVIVTCSDLLIAAPYQGVEQLRSGTWSTIRHAIKRIPVRIITPAGLVRDYP